MAWVFNATPRPLYPRKGHGTHWVGPRAISTDAENLAPHRDSIAGQTRP